MILAAVMLCGYASCASDDILSDVVDNDDVASNDVSSNESDSSKMKLTIQLNVPTLSSGSSTRAYSSTEEGEGYYEAGTNYENYIDIANENYRIYFFNSSNKYLASFDPTYFTVEDGTDYCTYNLLGEVPSDIASLSNFKIVVLANWGTSSNSYPKANNLTANTTIATICNNNTWSRRTTKTTSASNTDNFELSATNLMPFYGVHQYTDVSFHPGEAFVLDEPITLLRAWAKVEVILETDTDAGISFYSTDEEPFAGLKIHRYSQYYYNAPSGVYSQDSYDHESWEDDYVSTLHLSSHANDTTSRYIYFRDESTWTDEANGKTYNKRYAYIPEYNNKSTVDKYCSIKVKFNESDLPEQTIYFAKYTNGITDNSDTSNRLNIERNNLYRFHVSFAGDTYTLSLTVSNWEGTYENTYDFGDFQINAAVAPWDDEIDNDVEY